MAHGVGGRPASHHPVDGRGRQLPRRRGVAAEPARRRDVYYLLTYENPDADEQADGTHGWYVVPREGPIDGIVVHTTGTAGAPEVADYYATTEHPVSAHVVVDDHGWIKLLPDEYVAEQARDADRARGKAARDSHFEDSGRHGHSPVLVEFWP